MGALAIPAALRFWDKVEKTQSCWTWRAGYSGDGYGAFSLSHDKQVGAHRMAWELTCGAIPKGKLVLHRCDNTQCVNPKHLFLGTAKQNTQDMIGKGRKFLPKGELHPQVKLSEIQVKEIRFLYSSKRTSQRKLAVMFGVSQPNISLIVRGRNWGYLK